MKKVILHTSKNKERILFGTRVNDLPLATMLGEKFHGRILEGMKNDRSLDRALVYSVHRDDKYTSFYITGGKKLDILTDELPARMLTGAYAFI